MPGSAENILFNEYNTFYIVALRHYGIAIVLPTDMSLISHLKTEGCEDIALNK